MIFLSRVEEISFDYLEREKKRFYETQFKIILKNHHHLMEAKKIH